MPPPGFDPWTVQPVQVALMTMLSCPITHHNNSFKINNKHKILIVKKTMCISRKGMTSQFLYIVIIIDLKLTNSDRQNMLSETAAYTELKLF
jgi:hypothetical protein